MSDGPTLNELLERAARSPDGGLRILDRRERCQMLPWSEVHERARSVAGRLREAGVLPGQRVALVYPTSAGFFDAFFGTLLAGGVPVPLYPPVRLGRLDEYHQRTAAMLRAVDARLVLADKRVRRLLGPAVEAARPALGCRTIEELLPAAPSSTPVGEGDLALVQFSSGTTVEPKPVALSHRAVVAQTVRLNGFWPDSDGVVHSGASWLPLYHDMGLIGCVFPALERGAALTLIPPELFVARPAVWLRTISRYRATVSPAPNFAFGLCADRIRDEELEGVDLSSWRVALNGAEPVAADVLRRFQRRFAAWGFRSEALTPVYGLSEASLAVSFSPLDRPFTSYRFDRRALAEDGEAIDDPTGVEIVSVGRPLPDFEVRVVDRGRSELPERRVGRVMVRGPSLMEGYLGLERATARVMMAGWLDTGDLGFIAEGDLYLTGRAKDILILRGRNHSPVEVEHAVDTVEGVRTGCAAAASFMPEGADREQLVVMVETGKGVSTSQYPRIAEEVSRAVLVATGLEPDRVEVLEPGTLPRTSSGKIRRREALERWRAGALTAPAAVTPFRLVGAALRSSLAMARAERRRGHG
ncbi:MAG: fatty acyl-AMP ligase [Acidobacteria bacterium]|nr:fatty acyl-AMP ligase [Candidatus Sulfomarinibacter sp. MAG AM1]